MHFKLTDERQLLGETLARLLRDLPQRALHDSGAEGTTLWTALVDLGIVSALFPEDLGGLGGTGADITVIFESLGYAGAVTPLAETGLAAGTLVSHPAASPAVQALREAVVDGRVRVALGYQEAEGGFDPAWQRASIAEENGGLVLSGEKAAVVAAKGAAHFVVSAREFGQPGDRDGIGLFLVPADAPGLELRDAPMLGGGDCARLVLDRVPLSMGARIGGKGAGLPLLESALARATAAVCAEALGLMERMKDLTIDYLRIRKQFGRPLGSFQALQHRLADIVTEIEQARSATINVGIHLDAPYDLRERHVSAAKALIGRVGQLVVEETIQMHGGIGMTEEYELAHLARRLTAIDSRYGNHLWHLNRFITLGSAA